MCHSTSPIPYNRSSIVVVVVGGVLKSPDAKYTVMDSWRMVDQLIALVVMLTLTPPAPYSACALTAVPFPCSFSSYLIPHTEHQHHSYSAAMFLIPYSAAAGDAVSHHHILDMILLLAFYDEWRASPGAAPPPASHNSHPKPQRECNKC